MHHDPAAVLRNPLLEGDEYGRVVKDRSMQASEEAKVIIWSVSVSVFMEYL